MKKINKPTHITRAALLALLFSPMMVKAQAGSELHAGFEQYWKENLVYLKKIDADKGGSQAAADVNQMKTVMLPKFERQLQLVDQWKKTHTEAELEAEKKWEDTNPLQSQGSQLLSSLLVASARAGGEYGAAFRDYIKEMAALGKKYKK